MPHSNFEMRTKPDMEASYIAVASVLKAICEKIEIDPGRVRQFVESATDGDADQIARAQWLCEWVLGARDVTGHPVL